MNAIVSVVAVFCWIAAAGPAVAQIDDRMTCPITSAPVLPFVPPAPYPIDPPPGTFWFGTAAFWTMLALDGRWGVADEHRISQKVFWWRPGFNGALENYPDVTVTLKRLDRRSPPITATTKATNASHESFGGWAMLTGVSVPTAGCWEITGRHRGSEVTFIVQVDQSPRASRD